MRTLDLLSSQLGISECSQVCTSEHPIDTEKTWVPRLVVRNVPIIQVGNTFDLYKYSSGGPTAWGRHALRGRMGPILGACFSFYIVAPSPIGTIKPRHSCEGTLWAAFSFSIVAPSPIGTSKPDRSCEGTLLFPTAELGTFRPDMRKVWILPQMQCMRFQNFRNS